MNQPRRYLSRMSIFVVIVAVLGVFLSGPLKTAFLANAGLNGFILATFVFGIGFVFRQVLTLGNEIAWVQSMQENTNNPANENDVEPRLLAPMKALLADRKSSQKLSAMSMRSLLDSIAARLDEGREISRYLIGLLIFLGLLGTFWGLLRSAERREGKAEN